MNISTENNTASAQQADWRPEDIVPEGFVLQTGEKYRLTRQMYLFPAQEVTARVNDYLKIGAVVTYIQSGGLTEFNGISLPWVYVKSENTKKADMGKGREGWCFSHFLERAD